MDLNILKMTNHPPSPAKYNNNKHNIIFYKKWKKYYEIQLTKNKMDLNNRKMKNNPPSPVLLLGNHERVDKNNLEINTLKIRLL